MMCANEMDRFFRRANSTALSGGFDDDGEHADARQTGKSLASTFDERSHGIGQDFA